MTALPAGFRVVMVDQELVFVLREMVAKVETDPMVEMEETVER